MGKLNGIWLLLELMSHSLAIDNEICIDAMTILLDATQNNPMMQNHIYLKNGIHIILQTLKKCNKHSHKIRAKLWALIHAISRAHNPNFNIFLAQSGHREIARILRIEQNNINDGLLLEILRVSRLLNYMLSEWSDGNDAVFATLNILQSVNWAIYSLHSFVIRLVSANNTNSMSILQRMQTAQRILDILMELIGGIRLFMKRGDKCNKFIIANKCNKDIIEKVSKLQNDLRDYCFAHRPKLKMEEKSKNGKAYWYRYYKMNNDDDQKDEEEVEEDDLIYFAMKDIWNTIASILRHVKRYENHCKQQRKMHEIWKTATKKGKIYAKKEKEKQLKQQSTSTPSVSNQLVLYKKNNR